MSQTENRKINKESSEGSWRKKSAKENAVSSAEYTRDYYLTSCDGHEEFIASKGRILPLRLSIPLELADLSEGMQVIDIGCGRGEIIIHSAIKGSLAWGIDYAYHAVELASEAVKDFTEQEIQWKIGLQQADAIKLPFSNECADVVFMLDVVEHLLPDELNASLKEVRRVLKPGGQVIIHTMPNLWYYRIGYPIYRLIQSLRGEALPADPRQRWEYSHVHVNEQTPGKVKTVLRASKFETRVWLQSTVSYEYENSKFFRFGMDFVTRTPPFRAVFCNDIFAIGIKS